MGGIAQLGLRGGGALWVFSDLLNYLGVAMVMVACIYGFLRGKKRGHLWIACYMLLSISVQAYFTGRAIEHAERLPIPLSPHPWLEFAGAIVPHMIALICASVLYTRARRVAATPASDPAA